MIGGENTLNIYDGRESFYQWDLNQKITSPNIAIGDEIDFFNMRLNAALTVKAYEFEGKVVADVPNILLQTTNPIKVYRRISDGVSTRTVYEETFNVIQKAQPPDYFYTETELYALRTDVVNTLEETKEALALLQGGLEDAEQALELAKRINEIAETTEENEELRISAESDRQSAETERIEAEELRLTAEQERVESETQRVENENKRIESYEAFQEEYNTWFSNEEVRQENESQRIENEEVRNQNEEYRNGYEYNRNEQESIRITNEERREYSENVRNDNELDRIEAETQRAEAEQERIANEELRQANFESLSNNIGNAIKSSTSGEIIRVDDVSPIEHTVKGRVSGKNMLDVSVMTGTNLSDNGDDTYTFTKKTSGVSEVSTEMNVDIPAGVYVFSANITNASSKVTHLRLVTTNEDGTTQFFSFPIANTSMAIELPQRTSKIKFGFASSVPVGEFVTFTHAMLEKGDTATEYEPYIEPSSVKVTRCGKNILDDSVGSVNNYSDYSEEEHKFNVVGNVGSAECAYDTGQLMFPWSSAETILSHGMTVVGGKTYTITFDCLLVEQGVYNNKLLVLLYDEALTTIVNKKVDYTIGKKVHSSITFTPEVTTKTGLTFRLNNNKWEISNIQIECHDEATEFEPYKGETFTPSADGVVEITSVSPTMTLFTDTEGAMIDIEYNQDTNAAMGNVKEDIQTLDNDMAELKAPQNNVLLVDSKTNKVYKLYVENGKLMMDESEV